jgi:hypothetical protein
MFVETGSDGEATTSSTNNQDIVNVKSSSFIFTDSRIPRR